MTQLGLQHKKDLSLGSLPQCAHIPKATPNHYFHTFVSFLSMSKPSWQRTKSMGFEYILTCPMVLYSSTCSIQVKIISLRCLLSIHLKCTLLNELRYLKPILMSMNPQCLCDAWNMSNTCKSISTWSMYVVLCQAWNSKLWSIRWKIQNQEVLNLHLKKLDILGSIHGWGTPFGCLMENGLFWKTSHAWYA